MHTRYIGHMGPGALSTVDDFLTALRERQQRRAAEARQRALRAGEQEERSIARER